MYRLLKKYSDSNPEKFNKDFILSRDDSRILDYVKDIFESLEVLKEIKIEEVSLERDESSFGPIKKGTPKGNIPENITKEMIEDLRRKRSDSSLRTTRSFPVAAYKSILQSRLNKIHYKVRITPTEDVSNELVMEDDPYNKEIPESEETFIREGDIYLNKMVDKCFYINEGIRYYLIYQIVDNTSYSTKDSISLKSLLMGINIMGTSSIYTTELSNEAVELPNYNIGLFSKRMNPMLYFFVKEAYNSIVKRERLLEDGEEFDRSSYRDSNILKNVLEFLKVDLKFDDDLNNLISDESREIFRVKSDKTTGVYFSVSKDDLKNDSMTKSVVGSLLNIASSEKKKRVVFSYDQLISPMFWIDRFAGFFTKNTDSQRRFEKAKSILISLSRLIDDPTKKILRLPEEDKKDTLAILRYLIRDYHEIIKQDSQNLDFKRLRLFEYQLFPLRNYISNQIYRIINSPSRSKNVLDRIFSNLKPMYIIKQTIVNQLLRYYNAANEINLYSSFLKFSYTGAQAIAGKNVSIRQRDIHPSQVGRLSLVAASAGNPGLNGTLTPFIEVFGNGYLSPEE